MGSPIITGRDTAGSSSGRYRGRLSALLLLCIALFTHTTTASTELRTLALQQDLLRAELSQVEKQLAELQKQGQRADQSEQDRLTAELLEKERQISELAHRQLALMGTTDTQGYEAHSVTPIATEQATEAAAPAPAAPAAPVTMETKPLRNLPDTDPAEQEAEQVAHLLRLLDQHETVEQSARLTQPTSDELEARKVAHEDAQRMARIPFSVDKVRLNGAEGSTALSQISERLADPGIPESRRDLAPICSIRTRLFGSLIASEQRSLRPVGKHHYVTRLRLQPGDTTISIQGDRWEIRLPQDISARDYLVTLYRPPGFTPEFHLFSVDDLLAEQGAHIPAWLPPELKLTHGAG